MTTEGARFGRSRRWSHRDRLLGRLLSQTMESGPVKNISGARDAGQIDGHEADRLFNIELLRRAAGMKLVPLADAMAAADDLERVLGEGGQLSAFWNEFQDFLSRNRRPRQ